MTTNNHLHLHINQAAIGAASWIAQEVTGIAHTGSTDLARACAIAYLVGRRHALEELTGIIDEQRQATADVENDLRGCK